MALRMSTSIMNQHNNEHNQVMFEQVSSTNQFQFQQLERTINYIMQTNTSSLVS